MKKIICFLLCCAMLMAPLAVPAQEDPLKDIYLHAFNLLYKSELAQAIAVFESLKDYEDAAEYARYCRAWLAGEEGDFDTAVKLFTELGSFYDSLNFASYYKARALEYQGKLSEAFQMYYKAHGVLDSRQRMDSILDATPSPVPTPTPTPPPTPTPSPTPTPTNTPTPEKTPEPKFVYSGNYENINYNVYDNGIEQFVEISWYEGNESIIDIPEKIDGLPVKSIGEFAFVNCKLIAPITIPNRVSNIGGNPFPGIKRSELVISPDHPYFLFEDEFLIEKATKKLIAYIPDKLSTKCVIPDGIVEIGNAAFLEWDSLTSIEIPNSVIVIGNGAFAGCLSLASIHIPDTVKNIGINPFQGIDQLQINISPNHPHFMLKDGLLIEKGTQRLIAYIPDEYRTNCIIPDGIAEIGSSAFSACNSLVSIEIPESVTIIGEGAFTNCVSLASISIPNGVTNIESGAFYYCVSLTSIQVPDSLISIGTYAFSGCESLASVYIPKSVMSIENSAFEDCPKLTLNVAAGSYAEQYAKTNRIPHDTY